jgi:hypothetical protein
MASVSQQLHQYRESQKKAGQTQSLVKIETMSLEQLSKEKIAFGKAKLNQEFPEVFKDSAWTDWFVTTYEKSPKPEHQLFIKYVEKRLNSEIKQEVMTSTKTQKEAPADRKATASADSEIWDQISEPDPMKEFELPGTSKVQQMEEQMTYMQMENKNMSDRMAQLEMNLMEVLQHLRGLSVKSEP